MAHHLLICISVSLCASVYPSMALSVFLHLSAKSQKDWRRETVICWPEPKCDFENTEAGGKGRYLSASSSPTQAPPHPPCGPVPRSLGPLRPSSASPLPFPQWKTGPRMFCASYPPVGAPLHTCPPARGLDIKDSSVEGLASSSHHQREPPGEECKRPEFTQKGKRVSPDLELLSIYEAPWESARGGGLGGVGGSTIHSGSGFLHL